MDHSAARGPFGGKVVIITGGAMGIGRAAAIAFAREGAAVAIADVDSAAGQATVADCERAAANDASGGRALFVAADVASAAACRQVVAETVAAFGGVDVLFNNVGIQPRDSYRSVEDTSEEEWDRILGVNLKSHFLMAKYTIPELRRRGGGVIVNTASVQGLQSMRGVPAYAASKGGILSLTRQLAVEYAAEGIRVLAICPGSIDTEMVRASARAEADGEAAARSTRVSPRSSSSDVRGAHCGRRKAWLHRTSSPIPGHGDAALRRLHAASLLRLRRHRVRAEGARLFQRSNKPAIGDGVRVCPRTGTDSPPTSSQPVSGDRRTGQPSPTAHTDCPSCRAADGARRRPG
jgi:NAD(P)-dependent dehydrogenase (short-subunit alcohol dehydrogenase family)